MTRTRRPVSGLPALLAAISDSNLPRGEVAILKAMAEFADWGTGENVTASMASIARKAHYKPRQAALHMARLVEKGIVVIVRASRGGKGQTTVRRIDLDVLRAWHRDSSSSSDTGDRGRELCVLRPQTMRSVRANYAGTAPNHVRDQVNPPPPATRRPDSSIAGGRERPSDAVVEVVDLLRKQGVSPCKARDLAADLSVEVVRVGISMWRPMREKGAQAGSLVKLLQEGDATEEYRRRSRARASQRDRELLDRRTAHVDALMGELGALRKTVQRDEILRRERVVHSVWPSNRDIAAAGVLSDAELAAARERPLDLLAKLESAANTRRSTGSGPRPVVRRNAPQAVVGGDA